MDIEINEQQLNKSIAMDCRKSFFIFVKEFWEIFVKEEPIWNWHIEYLCNELEKVFYNVCAKKEKEYDLIINVPPGSSKSSIVTILFPCWCWIAFLPKNKFKKQYKAYAKRNNIKVADSMITGINMRFITGSYATPLSLEHSEHARNIIQSDKFLSYFPEMKMHPKKNAKSNFVNTEGGQRFTTSVGATVTGVHAHIILIDDPIDPKQAQSETTRATANNWMDSTLSQRKVDRRITVTIIIMQRLHMDDCTGHFIERHKDERIKHIVLPGTLEYDVKPEELAEKYIDGLLDPIRLNQDVLNETKEELGSYGYAGQVGQNPIPREGAMFQESWFEIVDAPPYKPEKIVRGWDLAGTSEAEAAMKGTTPAYTVGARISKKGSTFYVEHVFRERLSSGAMEKAMKTIATQDGYEVHISFPQDPGQAGKSQAKTISALLAGYLVKYSPETGDKLVRLGPFAAQCEAGNVKLVRGPWNRKYLDELCAIPNGLFMDQADATSRAFNEIHVPSGKKAGSW